MSVLLLALELMNRCVSSVYEIAKVIYGEDEILSVDAFLTM